MQYYKENNDGLDGFRVEETRGSFKWECTILRNWPVYVFWMQTIVSEKLPKPQFKVYQICRLVFNLFLYV